MHSARAAYGSSGRVLTDVLRSHTLLGNEALEVGSPCYTQRLAASVVAAPLSPVAWQRSHRASLHRTTGTVIGIYISRPHGVSSTPLARLRVSGASAFSCYSTLLHGSSLSVHRPLPPPWSLLSPRLSCSISQLIAFFSPDYFASFFHRDEPDQRWTALPASRSLVREWRLSLPPSFSERGFHEHIHDEDYEHHGEIWFFGELS